jgi:hypothetical protein
MALLSTAWNILTNKSTQNSGVDGAHKKYGRMEEKEVKFRVLWVKLKEKSSLGTPKYRRENIKISFKYYGVDWIHSTQDNDQWRVLVCTVRYNQVL